MRTMISAKKADISSSEELLSEVSELSIRVAQVDDYFTISPKPGKLFDLLKLLRDHRIEYTTNFNIDGEI